MRGKYMYFVPDNTDKCGLYMCKLCENKFLSLDVNETTDCPYCSEDVCYEIGPDETLEDNTNTATLVKALEGEDVEKYDSFVSLAITGGNYEWI